MSQVDYLHFFNNSLWNYVQIISFYIVFCMIFVQILYKGLYFRFNYFIKVIKNFFFKQYIWLVSKITKKKKKIKYVLNFIINIKIFFLKKNICFFG